MKHVEQDTPTTQDHEAITEEVRPLRLDREALRLDPPVVRFSELQISDSHSR